MIRFSAQSANLLLVASGICLLEGGTYWKEGAKLYHY